MKKYSLILLLITVALYSCKSSKNISLNESKYYTDSIYSSALNEYRQHNIYLPKGFNKNNNYPIFYATDGNTIEGKNFIVKSLDSLINNEIIQPIIFIESHSNRKIADSTSSTLGNGKKVKLLYRNFEYVENQTIDSILLKRFSNHMHYFKDELITHIEKQLNQKNNKENRYFYGVSNGGGFGMSLLNKNPNLIGTYFCFSVFGGDIQTNNWNNTTQYPNLYLIYGHEEPFFLKNDADFITEVYQNSNSYSFIEEYEGGHDYRIWNTKLINFISNLFSTKK